MKTKRTKYDIYAEILETIKRFVPCSITHAAYGASIPLDRAKIFMAKLVEAGLVKSEESISGIRYYITEFGLEFLEIYWTMKKFLEMLK